MIEGKTGAVEDNMRIREVQGFEEGRTYRRKKSFDECHTGMTWMQEGLILKRRVSKRRRYAISTICADIE
jgi:hypothetical protein